MSKVESSYQSVLKGVSQQTPQARLSGQHTDQVNMLSDPVHGLTRRHGSTTLDEKSIGIELTDARQGYARGYREFSFYIGDTEYSLVYQSGARPAGEGMPFCFCLNKSTGKFLTVSLESGSGLDAWVNGGVSSVTMVGQYLVLAGNTVSPTYTTTDNFAASEEKGVGWIRGGQYSRTYTLSLTRKSDGTKFTATYKTMASSYPNLLDTSDIATSDPDYQKKVNDRVNAYNSAATQWIGDAAADIQPHNIATKLVASLTGAGFTTASVLGGTVVLDGISALSCDDGGDGTLFRAVLNEITDVNMLSGVHYPGKVVRIKAQNSDPYYLVAKPDDPTNTAAQTVSWAEGPAQTITPGQVFALGCLSSDGTTLYLASTPAALSTLSSFDVPEFSDSVAGSLDEIGAVPFFFGNKVSLLTVFQDRLVIVSQGTVFMSRIGDYFNWFRASAMTVADDDPIEAYALGAEDDIISRAVTYSQDLFMFGERQQYAISGRTAVTPKTVAITAAANDRDAAYARPAVVGNLLFYGKYTYSPNQSGPSPYSTSISQFQLGLYEDAPETYEVSQQLGLYMRGRPIEIQAMSAPSTAVVRTDGHDYGLYVYSFIDQAGSQTRLLDSWSRWEWDERVGQIIGFSMHESTILVITLRKRGTDTWVACEQFVMDGTLAASPYLDMQRPMSTYNSDSGCLQKSDDNQDNVFIAATVSAGEDAWLGTTGEDYESFFTDVAGSDADFAAVAGVGYDSYFEPTPPYVRDQNQQAVVNGRLVITRYTVSVANTGGCDCYLTAQGVTSRVKAFNGRLVGHSNNQVGRQPISSAILNVSVGRANTEHQIIIKSRYWLPLSVTAIEWVGQLFLNTRRV